MRSKLDVEEDAQTGGFRDSIDKTFTTLSIPDQ